MTALPGRLVLLGHPVTHSLSPIFQGAALRHLGIPLAYTALDVPPERLAAAVTSLRAERAGGNVTAPHKVHVAALCDRRTATAERTGAVNTFWTDTDAALVGDNTDVAGFVHLAVGLLGAAPHGLRIALLGAGGAAAAVCAAAEGWPGCEVAIWSRSPGGAERLAARFTGVRPMPSAAAAARDAGLIVNATPIGRSDDALPLELAAIPAGAAVADLVYHRGETAWVRAARARGHPAADGLAMLLEQGALAFERWIGRPAPRDVMRTALA